jgi:hypothetical protein
VRKVRHNKSRFRFKTLKGQSETVELGPRRAKARLRGPQPSSALARKT